MVVDRALNKRDRTCKAREGEREGESVRGKGRKVSVDAAVYYKRTLCHSGPSHLQRVSPRRPTVVRQRQAIHTTRSITALLQTIHRELGGRGVTEASKPVDRTLWWHMKGAQAAVAEQQELKGDCRVATIGNLSDPVRPDGKLRLP
jgi:hypothetical protein